MVPVPLCLTVPAVGIATERVGTACLFGSFDPYDEPLQ